MTGNLRIISVTVIDSSNITAVFTESLSEDIGVPNVSIISQTAGVPNSQPVIVTVSGATLSILTQPMIPFAAYFIVFQSTPEALFSSLNGDAVLPNDGVSNRQLIIGAALPEDPSINYLTTFLANNVYNTTQPSVVSSYIQGVGSTISQTIYDIRQAGNENYLSYTVTDEQHTRGAGPYDRLNEESAYEVLRVGTTPTDATLSNTININPFPPYVVSLIATANSETLVASSLDTVGTFNLDDFTLNLSQQFVIILTSVVFVYNSSVLPYTYNIQQYGYQILNSEYDPNYAFTYLQLNNNQIKLNDQVLNDPNFSLDNIANIQVSYQFKDTGKVIDAATVSLDTDLFSGREVVPPIENIFTLMHAPIVTSGDELGTVGDVTFIDPNALPGSNTPHPAFLYEIPYSLNYLPSTPGQYAVDYSTGNVYVYGASSSQDGTGPYPPLASYTYRYVFSPLVDYVYDSDTLDLAALPLGNLTNADANVSYEYEEVLAQGIDYQADVHIEALNEEVDNRLLALNAVRPLNTPVTDVFRILNETTGEIYNLLRFTDNTIYYTYVQAPNIEPENMERATFADNLNETLFINSIIPYSPTVSIYQFFLNFNHIIAQSQDCIGSSVNTTVTFSDNSIFAQEVYFDSNVSDAENLTRLVNIGQYQIDYFNGVVWVMVPSDQSTSVGTISYRYGTVVPNFPNVITVEDIYYQLSPLTPKTKHFSYVSFTSGAIVPSTFDISNETLLNDNSQYPYLVFNGQIGTFNNATFVPGVSDFIKSIRGIYEKQDILYNPAPINFAPTATFNGNTIAVNSLPYSEYHTVQFNGTNYYILLNTALYYQSPNITLNIQVRRLTDNVQLWNNSGTVVLGNSIKLILPGVGSPSVGNPVLVTYSYSINNFSEVVADYDKGGYYIDYTYLADNISISYEYGDNILDFSQSMALNTGETYFVTYKVGALRTALLKNFGTLIDLPLLNDLDTSFDREDYRDSLIAAMQSFTAGPTKTSIANIVQQIVKTPPQILESAFQNWTLGQSLLNPQPIETTGEFSLVPAKYGAGVSINQPEQTITFPISSNLRLEDGSLETWILPQWNGIDNKADLFINIFKDYAPIRPQEVFIGPAQAQPIYVNGNTFKVNTADFNVLGKPNQNKNGVFIYYAPDITGLFDRWYIDVIDGYADGYSIKNYAININTDGRFYDVKSTVFPLPPSSTIRSTNNSVKFYINGTADPMQGITFVADNPHYIFDFGSAENANRFSLYKDESGYMNFRVIDKNKVQYNVSADISSWEAGQLHQVAASWSIGSRTKRDELHLFLDGLEVPNIVKYGSKVPLYLHEKYRTVDPEEIVGKVPRPIVGFYDMTTAMGSTLVTSSINFTAEGILPGDTLYIEEPGYLPGGYTIAIVDGQNLTLTVPVGITMTGATYSINKTSFDTITEMDLYPNVAISLLHVFTAVNTDTPVEGNDLQLTDNSCYVTSTSTNFTNAGVQPGFIININEAGLAPVYTIVSVNGNTLMLDGIIPVSASNVQFFVYSNVEQEIPGVSALHPAYSISRDANFDEVLTIMNSAEANDIVLIRTLGMNHRLTTQTYYVWADGYEPQLNNVIMTRMPAPILLGDVDITHILLSPTNIGPSNSTYVAGEFVSNQLSTDQPSISDNGRTLSVYISGDNVSYINPVQVIINGTVGGAPNTMETLFFTQNNTQFTVNQFEYVNYVQVICTPINPANNSVVVEVEEQYPITTPQDSTVWPVIRYSYQVNVGNTLVSNSTNIVSDPNVFFSSQNVGNYLVIYSPPAAAGQYQITEVSTVDGYMVLATDVPVSFTNGNYEVLNPTTYRSGLQNGFFTFENANVPGEPYNIVQGSYRFQYNTYISIPMQVGALLGYVGSDMNGENQADATLNQFTIISQKLTDVRVGDVVQTSQETITTDYNSLKAPKPNVNTLMLLSFNSFPFTNAASIYTTATNLFTQSSASVNDNFGQSLVLTERPFVVDNRGILIANNQGTIEFWVSPMFDTGNDPNYRYYFDATGIVSEKVVSINNATVKVAGRISSVLNVKLQVGYGSQSVDYFAGGTIAPDMQTIYLRKPLPNQNTPVVVNYIPTGVQGDRISIFKDPAGYINFSMMASGTNYTIRAPAFWTAGTWHRLKAEFQVNQGLGSDELHFFIDGYERGNVLFGNGLLFGQNQVFGSSYIGPNGILASISFKDTINEFFVGSDYTRTQQAFALMDNLRISDIARPLFMPFGESIDVNYSSNLSIVYPVASDLYTTLLLNFDSLTTLNTNFSTLKNRYVGQFDFTVNVFDSFNILLNSQRSVQVLENLINTLAPANTYPVINIEYSE